MDCSTTVAMLENEEKRKIFQKRIQKLIFDQDQFIKQSIEEHRKSMMDRFMHEPDGTKKLQILYACLNETEKLTEFIDANRQPRHLDESHQTVDTICAVDRKFADLIGKLEDLNLTTNRFHENYIKFRFNLLKTLNQNRQRNLMAFAIFLNQYFFLKQHEFPPELRQEVQEYLTAVLSDRTQAHFGSLMYFWRKMQIASQPQASPEEEEENDISEEVQVEENLEEEIFTKISASEDFADETDQTSLDSASSSLKDLIAFSTENFSSSLSDLKSS